MDAIIFTDNWWNWFLHEYAFTLGVGWAVLKAIAVLDPSNKTNQVLDTFRGLVAREPKEMNRRATDQPPKE